jgi:hypothetical protein
MIFLNNSSYVGDHQANIKPGSYIIYWWKSSVNRFYAKRSPFFPEESPLIALFYFIKETNSLELIMVWQLIH